MNALKEYLRDIMYDKKNDPLSATVKCLLSLVSFVYGFLVRCNNFFYKVNLLKSYKVPISVISVGNITLGGTGKTPFAIMLAKRLEKPAILIRGYGEDEWKMLRDKLEGMGVKVFVGRDRVKIAKNLSHLSGGKGIENIILDDGFQHRRLKRDLDIVLLDSANPFGNRRLFPRGILREHIGGLKRADIIVLTKADRAESGISRTEREIQKIAPGKPIIKAFHKPVRLFELWKESTEEPSYINNKRVCIISAICDASYFRHTVEKTGARVELKFVFPDHYDYKKHDLEHIFKECKAKNVNTVITTEKDAVKLRDLRFWEEGPNVLALGVELVITEGEKELNEKLHNRAHMHYFSQDT